MIKRARLESLQGKHAELEAIIEREANRPHPDELMLRRLKKQKLALRDEIVGALTDETALSA
jgi:hypothetical protein